MPRLESGMAATHKPEPAPGETPDLPKTGGRRRLLYGAAALLLLLLGLGLYHDLPGRLGRALPEGLLDSILGRREHPDTARFTEIAAQRVALMDRFHSYEDRDTVMRILSAAGYGRWESHSRRYPRSPEYPPKDFDSLVLEHYRHLGVDGRLSLFFFNDRLYQAEFQPADAPTYQKELRGLGLRPRARDNARVERVDGDLRILSTVALAASPVGRQMQTAPWALWQDLRLVRQSEEWDARFGAIPKPALPG